MNNGNAERRKPGVERNQSEESESEPEPEPDSERKTKTKTKPNQTEKPPCPTRAPEVVQWWAVPISDGREESSFLHSYPLPSWFRSSSAFPFYFTYSGPSPSPLPAGLTD